MKEILVEVLLREVGEVIQRSDLIKMIEIPPTPELGDFALPCFPLSRIFRQAPAQIAHNLQEKLEGHPLFTRIAAVSGYLNFFVDRRKFAEIVLARAGTLEFGQGHDGQTVLVEFSSPNTNKPLHLGHIRNMAIGDCVARLLEFQGNRVIRTSINNDRGIHICKSMLAYLKYGQGQTPEVNRQKSDHFVGDYYVLYNRKQAEQAGLEDEAHDLLRKWEDGDPSTRQVWQTMREWALIGFRETYRRFGIAFDREYFESDIYQSGKEIVEDGLDRGIFVRKSDGATVIDLSAENLGEKVLLRADGTAIYIIQDLFLARKRFEEYAYDRAIYVVGNEQEYHFQVLFTIFRKLGYEFADRLVHLSYGMVELPTGKMKSREGTIVDADELISETQNLARQELIKRYRLSEAELEERSLIIALAALKYQILKVMFAKNILFDPAQAIRFEGDTGPYLLYSYARASSILKKAGSYDRQALAEPNDYEMVLIRKLDKFPDIARIASERFSPSIVCGYANELAQAFSEFYHNCPVIRGQERDFRLNLVQAFRSVMKKVLNLLGLREIEEM
ncbi:arginine--tRNA ligase [bacterium]|nr:arginine--tRNA ligase [bacterium]